MDVPQNRRSGRSCCRSCHSNGSCNCCHVAVAFAAANVHFHFMLHLAFTSRCALTLVPCPRPQYRSPNISLLGLSLSWAQEQRIHLVITWHLNGSGRYQSPVYLNSSHMLLKTGSILQRCPLGERQKTAPSPCLSSPRRSWTRTDCIPSRIRRFNPFFVMSSALKHTICLSRERERETESPMLCVCSVPHLELKETLRKTQSSPVELPSFACVLLIFQHFQEYQQCLPYNKHSVNALVFVFLFSFFPRLSSFLSLSWLVFSAI